MTKVNYIYAELRPDSRNKLEALLPFKFANQHGNYITLDWNVNSDLYAELIGKTYKLIVDTVSSDTIAQAIRVDLSHSLLRSVNKHPHITWSIINDWNAYYSNYMLEVTAIDTYFPATEIEVIVKDGLF